MLNRRILRIKAFKVLYTSLISGNMSLDDALKELKLSCESTRELYVFLSGMISPLVEIAKEKILAGQQKLNPTDEEKNPNLKFCNNLLLEKIESNPDFKKIFKKYKFSWSQYDLYFKRLYSTIQNKDYFIQYMNNPQQSLQEDCKLFIKIFEEEIVDSQGISEILEDLSIYWNDDLAYSLTQCCRVFESISKGGEWIFPDLYLSQTTKKMGKTVEDDELFVKKLVQSAFASYNQYSSLVTDVAEKWEEDRMYVGDIALVCIALSEIMNFPSIPVKVSMNEYVEISKFYCTPKSSIFVNGILDRLVARFRNEGKLTKE